MNYEFLCPDWDLKALRQFREWLIEQIAVKTVRHQSIKETRRLLVNVTARIMEMEWL